MAEQRGTGGTGATALATGVESMPADGPTEVHYHLPVEIEVRVAPEPVDPQAIAELALDAVAREIANT